MRFKWYLLRWLRGPANVAQGIVQTITLGFVEPTWALTAEEAFLDATSNAEVTG